MRGVIGAAKGGGAAAGLRGTAARPAAGFSVGGGGEAAARGNAAQTAGVSAAAAVGLSLLVAQEGGNRGGRDAAARRRAASILDELRGLQAEALGGRRDPARLRRLAELQAGEDGADPGLRETVRAVALRARVELARRGCGPAGDRSASIA